jgi:short-subunit dehydrogenase
VDHPQGRAVILAANGGGAMVNVLSVLSWLSFPPAGGYSAAKSALWAATNALRLSLAQQHTQVLAVHVGYMDTDMAAAVTAPKTAPEDVAEATLDALEAGEHEVLADELSRRVRAQLSGPLTAMYPSLGSQAAA